ncbi:response regulator [Microvirga roseola]|uniref:hypothetical protein n=1 Tax=Microvirga roseola TaxID=2883126 RepID=UPI001E2834C8|nr:hypothetical protein [Microvirga roseola]
MYASEPEASRESAVAVVDAMSFRRAGLIAVLDPWAASLGLTLLPMDVLDFQASLSSRMFILNIGGQLICEPDHIQWLSTVREQKSGVPFVVISDREEPEEMLRVFDAGAHGFIPTSTRPELALQALTFILGGGSFFPPTALLSFARDAEIPAKKSDQSFRKASLPPPHSNTLT